MSKNYYEILELPRTATHEQITHSFKRLSLKYHPLRNPTDLATNSAKFSDICEAYDILSHPERKSVFDRYGEFGLKEGVPGPDGKTIGGYRYAGNSYEIFDQFFGSTNPFADKFEDDGRDQFGSMFGDAFGGQNQPLPPQPEDIVIELNCTMYEFYNGSLKFVEFERQLISHDGRTTKPHQEVLQVEVKPGFSPETVLNIPNKGNEAYSHKPSKLVIKFKEIPHEQYQRKGNDLIYTHKITLANALESAPVQIKTLDGRTVTVTLDEVITPQTIKYIRGEGMSIQSANPAHQLMTVSKLPKGDLYVRFDIVFPEKLSNEQKAAIVEALRANDEENEQ